MKNPLFVEIHLPKNKPFDIQKVERPNFIVPWHFHPEIEILLVTKGKGSRFVGDSIEFFEPYDLVLVGPNLAHVWKNHQEHYQENPSIIAECIYLLFTEDSFGKDFFKIPEMSTIKDLISKAGRGIKFEGKTKAAAAEKIIETYTQTGIEQFISFINILNLLSNSNEYSFLSSIGYNQKAQVSDLYRLNDVLDYLMKNFKNEIKLKEIADIANMSPTSFCRYFKANTNKTLIQFINEIRIGHAHKMLIETQFNLDQISYDSGYNNISNFHEQFMKITGKSPGKFRKEHSQRVF